MTDSFTVDQQRALALANARRRAAAQQPAQPEQDDSLLRQLGLGAYGVLSGVGETGRGITQALATGAEAIGVPGAERVRELAAQQQARISGQQEDLGLDDETGFQVGEFAGRVAPYVALPGAAATLPGRVALGALGGAAEGATRVEEEVRPLGEEAVERGKQALVGAGLGAAGAGVLSGLGAGVQSVRNVLGRGKGAVSDLFEDLAERGIDETSAFGEVRQLLGREAERISRKIPQAFDDAIEKGRNASVSKDLVRDMAQAISREAADQIDDQSQSVLLNAAKKIR